jgi:hypothetical protein
MNSVLDDALERLHHTGPELHSGAPNHAPMVVETLTHLDEPDLVQSWLDKYSREIEPAPDSRSPVKPDEWDQALGARERYADWEVFFTTALDESPWRALLRDWISRLMPGMMAYGTHGLIRTAHAVRGLESAETPPRLAELSAGLSIWAAYFQRLPGTPRLLGEQNIRHSLNTLPRLPAGAERHGPPPKIVRAVDGLPSFPAGVDALAAPTDVSVSLSELSEAGARLYLANATLHPLVFVHAVTGPASLRTLLPYIRDDDQPSAFAYMWQAVAASTAAFGCASVDAEPFSEDLEFGPADIANVRARSIDTRDEHAIKFFDACLRETVLNPEPVYLRAAHDWTSRLLEARTWSHEQRIAAGLATV